MAGDENKHSGKQIGGSYRIIRSLGRGGFGDVYLAQHIFFANRPQVAIKLLRASLFSPKERERFIQEAQLLNVLTHPHILPILDAGMQEDLPYIVMEYAPDGSRSITSDAMAKRWLPTSKPFASIPMTLLPSKAKVPR